MRRVQTQRRRCGQVSAEKHALLRWCQQACQPHKANWHLGDSCVRVVVMHVCVLVSHIYIYINIYECVFMRVAVFLGVCAGLAK